MTSSPTHPETHDPHRWQALAVILSATLLGVLDFLIVNLALPSIERTIGATPAQGQLTVALYGLAFAVCLITGGRLGDIYGRKRIFQIGMGGFTFASALCGFAHSPTQLIVFRIIQGAFAALMSPQVLSTIQVTFEGPERDRATSYVGSTVGIGSFLGNMVGGWLVGANLFGLEWRPIFFVNVPIGIVALILSHYLVQESKSPTAKKLDVPGALISGVALFCLIFPISEGREQGWPWWVWVMLAASGLIATYFVSFEKKLAQRGGSPLIDLELFSNKEYGRGLLAILLLFSGMGSFAFVLAQFLQLGLHVPSQNTGTIFAALSISFFISSSNAYKVVQRIGTKTLIIGLTIMQFGQLILVVLPFFWKGHLNPYVLMPILFFYGLGQGLSVPQVIRQTMNTVTGSNAGAAAGVLSTMQQIAFSLGISIVGGVFLAVANKEKTPDSFAMGTTIAFAMNFLLVLIARALVARNIRLAGTPANTANSPVAVEA